MKAQTVPDTRDKRPRNLLQKSVKNDILVLHGVDPFFESR